MPRLENGQWLPEVGDNAKQKTNSDGYILMITDIRDGHYEGIWFDGDTPRELGSLPFEDAEYVEYA